ncbi:hypothetical protein NKJ06_30615 [Mesorhizobium sp. M0293]|uniref:hypothetical protein n=1 Tax=unclassified Mesorhizobium TaxID=325217 RepID=UPI003334AE6D
MIQTLIIPGLNGSATTLAVALGARTGTFHCRPARRLDMSRFGGAQAKYERALAVHDLLHENVFILTGYCG